LRDIEASLLPAAVFDPSEFLIALPMDVLLQCVPQ